MEENRAMNVDPNPSGETASQSEATRSAASQQAGSEQQAPGTAQEAPITPEKPKKDWKKEAREWIVSIAVALLVVFFLRTYLFQVIRVDGSSMYDTLLDNERLFVSVLDVRLGGVERGDIVICHYPNRGNTDFVKRAVGVPGDTVYRENGVTHVLYESDGATVDEPLDELVGSLYPFGSPEDYTPYTLGENEYFVVGDNRYNSHDSRDWNDNDPSMDVGPITGDMLMGKVRKVIWPIENIRDPKSDPTGGLVLN